MHHEPMNFTISSQNGSKNKFTNLEISTYIVILHFILFYLKVDIDYD